MADRSPTKILIALIIAIAIGAAVAVAGSDGSVALHGWPLFALCGALAFAINWLVFLPSSLAQTEKFYDLTGGISYLAVTLLACFGANSLDTRGLLVAALVVIWSTRLATFLFIRISKDGHDSRFDDIKTNRLRFFVSWTLQGLWVLLTAAGALVVITTEARVPMGWVGWLGLAVWVIGFGFEAIADRQKSQFRKHPANNGKFINTGLWAWSRHPNYFGEITLWIGVTIIALPVLSGGQWVALISPIFVTFLLTKVSGIPMLQEKAEKRWGDDPEFRRYMDNTPALIPRPPTK
ncbi:MAG: DUF1295 domain-containing protein [Woeseiaceae bacterium]